jgi:hypothetical protein
MEHGRDKVYSSIRTRAVDRAELVSYLPLFSGMQSHTVVPAPAVGRSNSIPLFVCLHNFADTNHFIHNVFHNFTQTLQVARQETSKKSSHHPVRVTCSHSHSYILPRSSELKSELIFRVCLEATIVSVYERLLRDFRIAAPVGPRRRDHAFECVVNTEHRHLATKCTPRRLRLSGRLVHDEREDEVRWRAALQRNQGILSPSPHIGRHLVIRHRALVVCSRRCPDVELPEELKRDLGNTEAANEVPRDEGIENLLCDVQNREVLHLEPTKFQCDQRACVWSLPGLRTVDLLRRSQSMGIGRAAVPG